MDTHVATHPDIEPDTAGMSARLPGEADDTLPLDDRLEAGERLPSSASKPTSQRRGMLLAGVALAAVGLAGGAFLVSPYNKIYPVAHLEASVNSAAQSAARYAQGTLRPILAPSASLASVSVPPMPPVTREVYAPKPPDQEVAELLFLHPGWTDPAHADHASGSNPEGRQAEAGAVHPPPPPAAADTDAPAGYVPSEPGSVAAARPPASAAAAPSPTPAPAAAAPAGPAPNDATALIIASLPQAQSPTAASPAAPVAALSPPTAEPDAVSARQPVVPTLPAQPDVLTATTNLRASPMTPPEQVQVLNLVTEMAAMVKDLRKQQAQLRSDLGKSSADVTARLTDYERRLALAEARSAVTAADDTTGAAPSNAPVSSAGEFGPASMKPIPVLAIRPPVAVVPSPSPAGAPKVYRVRAASPGLALLAQVDRGGGDGAQMQVVVGDTVPDYGRVKSIAQKGTAWVVTTERGNIQ